MIIDIIYSLILIVCMSMAILAFWYEKKARISPTPTLPWVRKKMMHLLGTSGGLKPEASYNIAELGAGWGGLTLSLAGAYPKSTITAYEISPAPFWILWLRALFWRSRIQIKKSDFFSEDLSNFDVLVCYLSPYHMKELGPQFATLKPGSLILSNAFPILDRTPMAQEATSLGVKIPVFLYRV